LFSDYRQTSIIVTFLLSASVLVYKLVELQLIDDSYKKIAERTVLDKQVQYPSRGNVYDRYDNILTYNKPIYDLECIYRNIDKDMDTTLFCQLLEIDKATFLKNIEKNWRSNRYNKALPFTFLSKISPEKYSKFQEQLFRFPGFYPVIRNIRAYPHENAAHVLGYLGEADMNLIAKKGSGYIRGDYVGQSGLEKVYEQELKGEKGVKFLMRDNVGREVSSFNEGKLDSVSQEGTDLYSTLDLELQAYCEKLMTNKRGSIVALEPSTGEILTMVSSPGYNPNVLNLDEDRGKAFKQLMTDKVQKPLLDRSISAKYPPGSIFKPILSLIAFQEGVFSPWSSVSCNGYYEYRTFKFGCHNHTSADNVKQALMHSCNSYFFEMVRKLIEKEGYNQPDIGLNILRSHLNDFGLGRKLGIDIPNEKAGFVPTPEFYDNLYRNAGGKWKSTYIMSIGIGQGELDLTTLQMANLAAIIANRGYWIKPHLIRGFSQDRQLSDEFTAKRLVRVDAQHFEPVIEGMRNTILYGTGYRANTSGITICGKTGTSQNPHGDDHSVFYAFAPKDNPQIALAVYVENAGFGGDIAAPIAGLVIEKYIKGQVKRPLLEEQMTNIDLISKDLPEPTPEPEPSEEEKKETEINDNTSQPSSAEEASESDKTPDQ